MAQQVDRERTEGKPLQTYIVLWIPTLTRRSVVDYPIKTAVKKNISDLIDDPFYLEIDLQDNHDIVISTYDSEGKKIFLKSLNFIQCSDDGLIEYSYFTNTEPDDDGFSELFWSEGFPCSAYDMIKELYHEHEFHDPESSINKINPFISKSKIDLQDDFNLAQLYYLKEFEKDLSRSLNVSQYAVEIIRKDSIPDGFSSMALARLRITAKGKMAYYNALIGGIKPGQLQVQGGDITTQQREVQNSIFNIENCMRYFNTIDFELEQRNIRSQIDNANKQIKGARVSIILTILLALAGIIVSWVCYNRSSKDLESSQSDIVEVIEKLETKIDSLTDKSNSGRIEALQKKESKKRTREQENQ